MKRKAEITAWEAPVVCRVLARGREIDCPDFDDALREAVTLAFGARGQPVRLVGLKRGPLVLRARVAGGLECRREPDDAGGVTSPFPIPLP